METNKETLWADWKRAGNENLASRETKGTKARSLVSIIYQEKT
jgi:hypothetical protein